MNKGNIFGLVGVLIGCIGIGYAIGTHQKMTKLCEKLDESIDELSESTPVEITDARKGETGIPGELKGIFTS